MTTKLRLASAIMLAIGVAGMTSGCANKPAQRPRILSSYAPPGAPCAPPIGSRTPIQVPSAPVGAPVQAIGVAAVPAQQMIAVPGQQAVAVQGQPAVAVQGQPAMAVQGQPAVGVQPGQQMVPAQPGQQPQYQQYQAPNNPQGPSQYAPQNSQQNQQQPSSGSAQPYSAPQNPQGPIQQYYGADQSGAPATGGNPAQLNGQYQAPASGQYLQQQQQPLTNPPQTAGQTYVNPGAGGQLLPLPNEGSGDRRSYRFGY